MKYRTLGKTGINVSEIGFGAWAIGGGWGSQNDDESIATLHKAIDNGVNFIDTAEGYGNGKSEAIIASVLKERKEDITVATKTPPAPGPWPPTPYCDMNERYSKDYLRQNIEQRLKFLDTDCIDILQLHTWTRAWNKNPKPFEYLRELQQEGLIKNIGISTPEQDQNCVIDLMRGGFVDVVQFIYNIFEQEPVAGIFPEAIENNVGIIVRVAFDEGVLTGKYKTTDSFPEDDFRHGYFAGDRLERAVNRVEKIKQELEPYDYTMPQAALKFVLSHPAVSTVIPGMRSERHADLNTAVSDLPDMPEELLLKLRKHAWNRGVWYSGK